MNWELVSARACYLQGVRLVFLVLLFATPFLPACSCSGNGHVTQTKFFAAPGDDVVNCVCNLTFNNEHCTGGNCAAHIAVQTCLPAPLQLPAAS